jgi:hypothetical protein
MDSFVTDYAAKLRRNNCRIRFTRIPCDLTSDCAQYIYKETIRVALMPLLHFYYTASVLLSAYARSNSLSRLKQNLPSTCLWSFGIRNVEQNF